MNNYNPAPLFDVDWSIVAIALRDALTGYNQNDINTDGSPHVRIFTDVLRERRVCLEAFLCADKTVLLVIRGKNELTQEFISWLGQLDNSREYKIQELTTVLHQMLATDFIHRNMWFKQPDQSSTP